MKKLATIASLALATAAITSGCAVDAVDGASPEDIDANEGAICSNPDGSNAMMAALATAIATELHRWEIDKDFEVYTAPNWMEMLRLKQSARGLCTNNCRNIDAILALQDTRNDQLFVFKDGYKLKSDTVAARLVAGWRNQKVCADRAATGDRASCVTEPHYLEKVSSTGNLCNGTDYGLKMVKYKVSKAQPWGPKIQPEQRLWNADALSKKLLWTDPDQTLPATGNPFVQFRVLSGGVEVELDPVGGTTEEPITAGTCGTTSLKYSPAANIHGTCCSVAGSWNTVYKPYALSSLPPGYYKCMPR